VKIAENQGRDRQKTADVPSLERVSAPSHITFVQAATSVSGEPERSLLAAHRRKPGPMAGGLI
jgi:hypothetical protein